MSLENEQDVLSDSSPVENNEPQPADPVSSEPSEPSEPVQSAPEDKVPFHLHPRFQELIQDRNALKEQLAQQAEVLKQVQGQMKQATPAERDAMIERLKGIDPEFATYLQTLRDDLKSARSQLDEFRNQFQQSSQESVQEKVSNMKNQFYSENKVPDDRKAIYEAMVQTAAASDPKLQISDLPKVMKQVHDQISKMFQTVERDTTKKFVETKKGEAAKPATQQRGVPARQAKPEQNLSREDLRAQMLKEAAAAIREGKDL